MAAFQGFFKGKRVFLTGHTGFKGSWLAEWLCLLGAEVHGYALDPQPHELLFNQLELTNRLAGDTRADLADRAALEEALCAARADVVFHLAAQPLVRLSYDLPVETFATNVMGTVHMLEAVRTAGRPCAVVCITTDKCYENKEWLHAYREEDILGGHDPYSASKGAAEIAISSYRRSFFPAAGPVKVASARAGNVIGGGDWAIDRIVPDCIRALRKGEAIAVRNKQATRPWQHVLEPLSGYLHLAASLASDASPELFASAFNFGPPLASNRSVAELVEELVKCAGGQWIDFSDPGAPHEASKLNLAVDKAFHLLRWQPVWNFEQTVATAAEWYLAEGTGDSPLEITRRHIARYQGAATERGLAWAS
ncbi:CDP-glucose 4,6-dehydratase [Luteolibacter sp. Populi]|uniref:CDP-glucose 4,6-dehydratase n=1 Tax=Luteolibacter sp. Populi TaxID=3230487 RepID=UPI00346566A6